MPYDKIKHREYEMPNKPHEGVRFEYDRFLPDPKNYYGILLHQAGELCCEAGYALPSHYQWCHEVSYIVSGSATFYCNGVAYPVSEGDLFITPQGVEHSISASTDEEHLRYTYLGFQFDEHDLPDTYGEIKSFFEMTELYLMHDCQQLLTPFYTLIEEFNMDRSCNDLMVFSILLQLLVLTYRSFSESDRLGYAYHARPSDHAVGLLVYDIMCYVEQNIFSFKGVNELAKKLDYSESYLSHEFKARTGQTLNKYLIQKKISKSIELFRLGNYSVSAVAKQMGYASVQSFSRTFCRETGYYPSRYIALFCRNQFDGKS